MSIKRLIAGFVAATCAAFAPVAAQATGGTPTGTGTADDPFVVMDADDLVAISESVYSGATTYNNGKTIVLGADIYLDSTKEWKPIGFRTDSPKLSRYWTNCTFDGQGYTIYNLTNKSDIHPDNSGSRQCGFIGAANGVTVKNLTFSGAYVKGTQDVGVIIGRTNGGNNLISNCVVKSSTVIGTNRMGGLCGNTMSSTTFKIFDSQLLDTTVSGTGSMVGGLVGLGQNTDWSASGCTISNLTITTSAENYKPGLVCGCVNEKNVTLTDLVIGGCGSTPLVGTVAGTEGSAYPVEVRIDGDSSLDVASFYGTASDNWRIRQYTGKSTYEIPANLRVPGSTLDSAEVEGKTWYTINTSKIVYVSNDAELRAIATEFNACTSADKSTYYGKYILMTNDIAMSDAEWVPIGGKQTGLKLYFKGTFDGDGHVISGLTMTNTTAYTYNAMFGAGNGLTIRNLTLSDLNISLDKSYVSAFIAISTSGRCYLENCKLVDSKLSGSSRVGGFFPRPDYGANIVDCMVSNVAFSAFGNKEGVSIGAIMGVPSTMGKADVYDTYCTNVVVYAAGNYAIGEATTSSKVFIGGESTLMDVSGIAPDGGSIAVDAGLYSVAIPTDYLAAQRKNQRETIDEVYWYRVVESHDGTGTENDPYVLEDEAKLIEMAGNPDKYAGTYIKMNADITLTKAFATAFGSDTTPFGGNFNGNNFSITCGDFVTADSFFGTVSNLVVKDLSISLTKPLIGKVLEGGTVSIADTTVGGPASAAVITENNGTLAFEDVVVTNAASALIGSNAGAATVTGADTDMDVAAICGEDSTGAMLMDNGRFHCAIPDAYVAEYYKVESDAVEGWNKVVPNKGSGTAEDPYILMNEEDVQELIADMRGSGEKFKAAHIKMVKDITLTVAVQQMTTTFTGVFDGNGKAIRNYTITGTADNSCTLFKEINKATIKNLTVKDSNISFGKRYAGLFANKAVDSVIANCTIENCTIYGFKEFGAYAYTSQNSTFTNCVLKGTTITYSDSSRASAFVHTITSGSTFTDCVVSGLSARAFNKSGAGTIIVDGANTSLEVSGFTGAVTIYAGEFSFDPTAYLAATSMMSTFTKGEATWYKVTPAVAKIGNNKYADVKSAFAAAQNGDTVELLRDYETSETATLSGKDVIFNLGGYTYSNVMPTTSDIYLVEMANSASIVLTNGTMSVKSMANDGDDGKCGEAIDSSGACHITIAKDLTITGSAAYLIFPRAAIIDIYGTIINTRDSQSCVWMTTVGAVVNVYDGAALTSKYDVFRDRGESKTLSDVGATLNIFGGTITGNIIVHAYIRNGYHTGTVNIQGGTFNTGKFESVGNMVYTVPATSTACFGSLPSDCVADGLPENYVFAKKSGDSYWRVAAPFTPGTAVIIGKSADVTIDQTVVPYGGTLSGTISNISEGYKAYVFVNGALTTVDENGKFASAAITSDIAVKVAFVKDTAWFTNPFVKNDAEFKNGYAQAKTYANNGDVVLSKDETKIFHSLSQMAYAATDSDNYNGIYQFNTSDYANYIGSYHGEPDNAQIGQYKQFDSEAAWKDYAGGDTTNRTWIDKTLFVTSGGKYVDRGVYEGFRALIPVGNDYVIAGQLRGEVQNNGTYSTFSAIYPIGGYWGDARYTKYADEYYTDSRYFVTNDINHGTATTSAGKLPLLQWIMAGAISSDGQYLYAASYARNEISKVKLVKDENGKVDFEKTAIWWHTTTNDVFNGNAANSLAIYNNGTKDIVYASLANKKLVVLDEENLSGYEFKDYHPGATETVKDYAMTEIANPGQVFRAMMVTGKADGTPHLICQVNKGLTYVYALAQDGSLVSSTPIVQFNGNDIGAGDVQGLTSKDDESMAYANSTKGSAMYHGITLTARPANVIVRLTDSTYEEGEDYTIVYGDEAEVNYGAPAGKKITAVKVNGVADTSFTDASYTFASAALSNNVYIAITTEDLPAAKIGTVIYVTLKEAFDAAQEGEKVEMLRDVALAEKLIINTAATTFDLGGYTLSAAAAESLSDGKLIDIAGGTITIMNGTIDLGNNELRLSDGVEVTLANDATIKSTYGWAVGVKAATLNVYGKVTNTGSECQAIWPFSGGGVVNVYDGAHVCGKGDAIRCSAGGKAYVNIYGGILESNGGYNPIYAYNAANTSVITISGGTFKASGGDSVNGMLNITGDSVVVTPLGDTCKAKFQTDRCGWGATKALIDYCAAGYAPFKGEDGYYTIQKIGAKIGTTFFLTVNDAINAAKDSDVVELCENATLSGTLTISKAVALNLAGKTINLPASGAFGLVIDSDATITNGTIKSSLAANLANSFAVYVNPGKQPLLKDLAIDASYYEYGLACDSAHTLADLATAYQDAPTSTVTCANVDVTGNGALIYAQWVNLSLDENCSAIANDKQLFGNESHRAAIYSALNARVTIAGGTYTHEKALLSGNLGAKIIVNGGTFNGQVYSWMDSTAHDDLEQYADYKAAFTLAAGTFNGAITFKESSDDARALDVFKKGTDVALDAPEGFKWSDAVEGLQTLVKNSPTAIVIAKIGDVEYTDLREALVACQQTETVQIVADIDLNNAEWTPVDDAVGTVDGGIYDENGVLTGRHVIKNLKVTKDGDYAGMFGKKSGTSYSIPCNLKNITFENVNITGKQYVGIAAYLTGDCTNVHVIGTIKVTGTKYVGALVGQGYVDLKDCHVNGGDATKSSITETSSGQVGAVAGFIQDYCSAVNCSAQNITIDGVKSVGGVFGRVHYGNVVLDCQANSINIVSDDTSLSKTGAIIGELYESWNSNLNKWGTPQFVANNTFANVVINDEVEDLPKYGSVIKSGNRYCLVYSVNDNAVWDSTVPGYKFTEGTFGLYCTDDTFDLTYAVLTNHVAEGYAVVEGVENRTYVIQEKPAGYDVTFTFGDNVTAITYAIAGGESGSVTSGTAITVPDGEKIIITPTAAESIKIPVFTSTPTEATGLQTFSFTNVYESTGAWTISAGEASADPLSGDSEAVKEATAGSLDGTTEEKVAAKEAIDAATTGDGAVAASDVAAWVSASTTKAPTAAELAAAEPEQIQLSVDFGTESLVGTEDAIKIDELEATTTTAEDKTAFNLTFEFKKGDDVVKATKAAKEKVAAIVKATSDLGDWTGDAKLTPTISADGDIQTDGSIKFKIELPKTSTKAFMKLEK